MGVGSGKDGPGMQGTARVKNTSETIVGSEGTEITGEELKFAEHRLQKNRSGAKNWYLKNREILWGKKEREMVVKEQFV